MVLRSGVYHLPSNPPFHLLQAKSLSFVSSSKFSCTLEVVCRMESKHDRCKTVVVGAGPVGALAARYAAQRGHDVEIYELRNGRLKFVLYMAATPRDYGQILCL